MCTVRSVHNYSRSSLLLNSLPNCSACILILFITQYDSLAHDLPIFRPLEAYAHLAYALTTIGEAPMDRTLPNQSLPVATFEQHYIHLTTTLHALINNHAFTDSAYDTY